MSYSTRNGKQVELKQIEETDAELINKIYFYTRNEEFAALGWSNEMLEPFLRMQCDFQQKSYEMQFPRAEYSLIVYDQKKAGRLIVERGGVEIRLVDIAILPEFRNYGIGSVIINELIAESEKTKIPLTLNVEKNNRAAFRLYERLGFKVYEETDIYYSMEKIPNNQEK